MKRISVGRSKEAKEAVEILTETTLSVFFPQGDLEEIAQRTGLVEEEVPQLFFGAVAEFHLEDREAQGSGEDFREEFLRSKNDEIREINKARVGKKTGRLVKIRVPLPEDNNIAFKEWLEEVGSKMERTPRGLIQGIVRLTYLQEAI